MINSISNNKIPSGTTERSGSTETAKTNKDADSSSAAAGAPSPAGNASNADSVNVRQATELYNRVTAQTAGSDDPIDSSDAASALTATIVQQIAEDGAQALAAQTDNLSQDIGVLLQTGPA